MSAMPAWRLVSPACFAAGFVAAALLAPSAAAAEDGTASQRRSCGTIPSTSIYTYARVVAIRGVRCRIARRVAKAYDERGRMLGSWRCGLAHNDLPRLFSCGAGGGSGDLRKRRRALEAIGTNRRSSAGAARCRTVSYGGRTYILSYRGMRCAHARKRVRHVHRHKKLRGWQCSSGSGYRTGGFCKRGERYFTWHPVD